MFFVSFEVKSLLATLRHRFAESCEFAFAIGS